MIHRFFRFSLVGLSGALVNLGLLYLLVEYVHLGKSLAWFIAVSLSILNNYLWNSIFTYPDRDTGTGRKLAKRAAGYYLVSLAAVGLNYIVYVAGMSLGFSYLLAALAGILVTTLLNFILAEEIIWRRNIDQPG
jgi:dolichol-phosphate mannosyltransferase